MTGDRGSSAPTRRPPLPPRVAARFLRSASAGLALAACALVAGCSGGIADRGEVSPDLVTAGVLDEWPLTVDRAEVQCWDDGAVTLRVDGETFALNGRARELTWHDRDWRHATAIAKPGEGVAGWTPALLDLMRYATEDVCGF